MNDLRSILRSLPKPIVMCVGHTLGFFDKETLHFRALVPPYNNKSISEVARLLGIGETPLQSLELALNLIGNEKEAFLLFLLNDTTHIPSKLTKSDRLPTIRRLQLVESFFDSNGLPSIYLEKIKAVGFPFENVIVPRDTDYLAKANYLARKFWTESELRNHFFKMVKKNHRFFEEKVSVTSEENRRTFSFKRIGNLNYCKLSKAPDSLTGGPECVAEVIELCLEVFGCHTPDVTYLHSDITNYSLVQKSKGTGSMVIFYPRICHDHVINGLMFYKEHLSTTSFEWASIPYGWNFNKGIEIGNIVLSITQK